MINWKRILFLVLLAILLVIPYGLRVIDSNLEPYPAILMPVGASLQKNLDDNILTYNVRKVFGFTFQGKLEEIDLGKLLGGIPSRTAGYNFGLLPVSDSLDFGKIGLPHLEVIWEKKSPQEDVDTTKKWIRERLKEQNLKDSVIIIRNLEVVLDRKIRKEISKQIIDEKSITLYK